ncbi:MAG: hypothetical protein DSM106950_37335 [Stigonema ocellatum SAG 48.90 = DSM 106950]|nr:hypothetical protein [Stigonema ocellatum SAG 48.90 = DSM 106950]
MRWKTDHRILNDRRWAARCWQQSVSPREIQKQGIEDSNHLKTRQTVIQGLFSMTFSPKEPYQPPEEEPKPNGKEELKEDATQFEEAPPLPPLKAEDENGVDDDPDIFKKD